MSEVPSNQDQIIDTCQTLISEYQALRNKFHLPNPNLIFGGKPYTDFDQQRINYRDELYSVAKAYNLPLYRSPNFFQQHPNLGAFYLSERGIVLTNSQKIGKIIDSATKRKYDRGDYLMDLTQEVVRGLIHQSNPEISPAELARQSVLSAYSSEKITPDFVTSTFPSLVQKSIQIHTQIAA